jgi:hypothetical protein
MGTHAAKAKIMSNDDDELTMSAKAWQSYKRESMARASRLLAARRNQLGLTLAPPIDRLGAGRKRHRVMHALPQSQLIPRIYQVTGEHVSSGHMGRIESSMGVTQQDDFQHFKIEAWAAALDLDPLTFWAEVEGRSLPGPGGPQLTDDQKDMLTIFNHMDVYTQKLWLQIGRTMEQSPALASQDVQAILSETDEQERSRGLDDIASALATEDDLDKPKRKH